MAVHHDHEEPVVERRVVTQDPVSTGLTGYAFVKYAFILAITIVVLFFIAKYLLPMF